MDRRQPDRSTASELPKRSLPHMPYDQAAIVVAPSRVLRRVNVKRAFMTSPFHISAALDLTGRIRGRVTSGLTVAVAKSGSDGAVISHHLRSWLIVFRRTIPWTGKSENRWQSGAQAGKAGCQYRSNTSSFRLMCSPTCVRFGVKSGSYPPAKPCPLASQIIRRFDELQGRC